MTADSSVAPRKRYLYLFGPVPSRRLGRSLGVDLLVPKTCSFDCLFCEAGRTSNLTVDRRAFVPASDVVAELRAWFDGGGQADVVTLAGSGEPTLHSGFGDVVDAVHRYSSIRAALLTNGSLLHIPEVRDSAARADLVKMSLSAWDPATFQAVNRPDPSLDFDLVCRGLTGFRDVFYGELWLEVFILDGMNDDEAGLARMARVAAAIRPDRIHLNTVVRPPAYGEARAVDPSRMARFCDFFGPKAEVIASFAGGHCCQPGHIKTDDLLGMLARRPCTAADAAAVFLVPIDEARKCLDDLARQGTIRRDDRSGVAHYTAVDNRSIGR